MIPFEIDTPLWGETKAWSLWPGFFTFHLVGPLQNATFCRTLLISKLQFPKSQIVTVYNKITLHEHVSQDAQVQEK